MSEVALAERIRSLQSLRALAAMAVVLRHCCPGLTTTGAGVDLFFVIAGFIMVHTSQSSFGRPASVLPFLARRFLRIAPAYWAATMLIASITGVEDWGHVLRSLLFIPEKTLPMLPPGWTLTIELFFYLLFAACLSLRQMHAILTLNLLLILLCTLCCSSSDFYVRYYAQPLLLEFGLGTAVAYLFHNGVTLSVRQARSIYLICVIVLVASAIPDEVNNAFWVRFLMWGCPAALVLLAVVIGPKAGWMESAVLVRIGDASYSIYLTHWFWILAFDARAPVFIFIASIVMGIGFHTAVERPLMSILTGAPLGHLVLEPTGGNDEGRVRGYAVSGRASRMPS